jgi:hypothetical protein
MINLWVSGQKEVDGEQSTQIDIAFFENENNYNH